MQCPANTAWSFDPLASEKRLWHRQTDVFTYSITSSACEKGQQWITATPLLQSVAVAHADRCVHVQCDQLCRRERSAVDHSDPLASEMQLWHMQTDVFTYSVTSSACEKVSSGSQGRPCSRDAPVAPADRLLTYSVTSSACEKVGSGSQRCPFFRVQELANTAWSFVTKTQADERLFAAL